MSHDRLDGSALAGLRAYRDATYQLDRTVFLVAHTISEVLDLVAFILVLVAWTQRVTSSSTEPATSR